MAGFPITCAGVDCSKVFLAVPGVGPWHADCTLIDAEAPQPSGKISLVVGDVTLNGTIDPAHSGTFGGRRAVRVIAGGGGWSKLIGAAAYANDAGVKASDVAKDAAAAAGEQLGATVSGSLGNHFVRQAGPASAAIEAAAGGLAWWVDYGGVTQIGKRFSVKAAATARVLDYSPQQQRATLTVDSLSDLPIGATLTSDAALWDGALTVASLEMTIGEGGIRVSAWLGAGADNLVEVMRRLIARLMPPQLFGVYKYRVVRMNVDRVDLQVVNKAVGLPDIATADMWPGLSGTHAKLTPGTLCAVVFLDGNRSDPVITNFVGRGGPGQTPESIELGGPDGVEAAGKGNSVDVLFPPMVFSGTIAGQPATGVVTAMTGKTLGVISDGSGIVKIRMAP